MLKNLLSNLEDPSAPFMGPYIRLLRFSGLLVPKKGRKRYIYIFLYTMEFLFGATEIIDLWHVKSNIKLLLNNLKITMLATVSLTKAAAFLSWQKHWKEILNYVNRADKECRKSTDEGNQKIISETTAFSRTISYSYCSLSAMTCVCVIVAPILKYILLPTYRENARNGVEEYMPVLSSWVPFDRSTMPGYIASFIYQSYATIYAGCWISSFDTNAMAIMTFFKFEAQLLRRDSSRIFGTEESPVDVQEVGKRIKECHIRHREMIKYVKLFNSCLSPIMLLYVIVCSIMLCVTSYQMTIEKTLMERIPTAVYLLFGVSQLFLYCWHSNEVLYISADLNLGPYESLWWNKTAHRKSIIILMIQFNKEIVLTAGRFAKITMPTFISILKGAYSYYTILSQSYGEN